ncbi:MAG: hypothetical protein WCV90_06330 [Candidatus Woesearchaeota archaeon]|jgi:thymidylate kinase
MSNLFVVGEGVDKGGKTSVLKYVCNQLTKEGADAVYRKGIKGDGYLAKLSSVYPSTPTFLLEQMEQNINLYLRTGIVLQDRWYYSVVSYPENGVGSDIISKVVTPFLREPDLLLYFTCSLEERLRRLEQEPTREHLDLINHPEKIEEWENKLLEHYVQFSGTKYLIDTTYRRVEESGEEVLDLIKLGLSRS